MIYKNNYMTEKSDNFLCNRGQIDNVLKKVTSITPSATPIQLQKN